MYSFIFIYINALEVFVFITYVCGGVLWFKAAFLSFLILATLIHKLIAYSSQS